MARFAPGTLVHVHYDFSPDISALVCETPEDDLLHGWVLVEQISDYEGETERPRFLALASMITSERLPQTDDPHDCSSSPVWLDS